MAAALRWGALSLRSVTAEMNSQYRDMHMRKLLLTSTALVALTAAGASAPAKSSSPFVGNAGVLTW